MKNDKIHTSSRKLGVWRRLILSLKPSLSAPLNKFLSYAQGVIRYSIRDLLNVLQYGLSAPKFAERIFIDPNKVSYHSTAGFSRKNSGLVIDSCWDKQIEPLTNIKKIRIAYEFLESQKTWDECGAYKNMAELIKTHPGTDELFTEADIVERYERLSQFIENLKSGEEFLDGEGFRENGGVLIHIGKQGELIFGGGGCHRLAISQKLNLPFIPCQIGVVHAQFLKENSNKMKALKTKPTPLQP